jgi:hypothetical protein
MSFLPVSNLSERLFRTQLAQCNPTYGHENKFVPQPCCSSETGLQKWYTSTPVNLWNQASNSIGSQGFSKCGNDAYIQQCLLSQHYKLMSGNLKLRK